MVVLAGKDGLERLDRLLERHEATLDTGEDLGDRERLQRRGNEGRHGRLARRDQLQYL